MATSLSTIDPSVDIVNIFDDYSLAYDLLLEVSPPYQQLQQYLKDALKYLFIDPLAEIRVLDIGAGTGNFSRVVLDCFPNATIDIVEPNRPMLERAYDKLQDGKVTGYNMTFQEFKYKQSYDLVICFHALYLMDCPKLQIPKFGDILCPKGHLIICDIGKKINVLDWSIYLFGKLYFKYGWKQSMHYFKIAKAITTSNKKISKLQSQGQSWVHSLSEFNAHIRPFFSIQQSFKCYRGYSNFIVGIKR